MSTQAEAADEHPPRDGVGVEASPAAEPSETDGGGPAGLKGKGGDGGAHSDEHQLEDFLYVDVDVENSGKKDSDADNLGTEGQREAPRTRRCLSPLPWP